MKITKYTETVQSRSCWGQGAYITDLRNFKMPTDTDVKFSIIGKKGNTKGTYAINMSSEDLGVIIATVINSDHVLIMKQILKEMGEI